MRMGSASFVPALLQGLATKPVRPAITASGRPALGLPGRLAFRLGVHVRRHRFLRVVHPATLREAKLAGQLRGTAACHPPGAGPAATAHPER